ncbi:MAG: Fe-S cluster assembly protein IscX [Planctomycetota bacterium]
MNDTFHWLDVERIAEELADAHDDRDPMRVTFPELRTLVESLGGFEEQPGHPVNEKILEAIQMAWISERDDLADDED